MFLFLTCLLFCLDSYLTLPLDFGVYHCEYHYYLLLVLQGTVGAQKIGVVRNTMQVFCNFRQVYHCQKLSKSAEVRQSYCKSKKGAVFFETQCTFCSSSKNNHACSFFITKREALTKLCKCSEILEIQCILHNIFVQ